MPILVKAFGQTISLVKNRFGEHHPVQPALAYNMHSKGQGHTMGMCLRSLFVCY